MCTVRSMVLRALQGVDVSVVSTPFALGSPLAAFGA
jgi:hypothetical protein